jgi:hypothetical protein
LLKLLLPIYVSKREVETQSHDMYVRVITGKSDLRECHAHEVCVCVGTRARGRAGRGRQILADLNIMDAGPIGMKIVANWNS